MDWIPIFEFTDYTDDNMYWFKDETSEFYGCYADCTLRFKPSHFATVETVF